MPVPALNPATARRRAAAVRRDGSRSPRRNALGAGRRGVSRAPDAVDDAADDVADVAGGVATCFPNAQRELVATSLIGVEQLTETVHEFLDLTRIEAGELRLNLEPVHVSAVIAEALRRVEGQAKAQGISLEHRASIRIFRRISADPLRACARSSTTFSRMRSSTRPKAGSVTVESQPIAVRSGEERRRCPISDRRYRTRHPGAFRSRVFDKFFRLEHHQSDASPGGTRSRNRSLHVSADRRASRWQIACSAGPGDRGTCITVTLPARVADHTPAPLESAHLRHLKGTLCDQVGPPLPHACSASRPSTGQQSAHVQRPAVPFRAGIDLVSLSVTVTDSEQHYVADLSRSDFVVLENGVPQDLRYFATTGVPLALALLIDTSASMQDNLGTAQEAAIGFARQLTESDIATVINFDSSVEILQEFTNDAGRLKDAIRRTAPVGQRRCITRCTSR